MSNDDEKGGKKEIGTSSNSKDSTSSPSKFSLLLSKVKTGGRDLGEGQTATA